MTAFDSDLSFETKYPSFWVKISRFCNKLFLNRYFFLLLFCLGSLIIFTEQEVLGAVIFVGIICLALILCEDILATTLPFLLLCVFVTNCYDSYDTFIPYIWAAIPAILSILFHFIVYRKRIQIGSTFIGLIAVSVALILGGVGVIPAQDYFRPGTLYYTLGLGIGMVGAYLLLKSQLCVKRDYDVREKFISMLYIMGMFACVMVLFFLTENAQYMQDNKAIADWQPSNNISTILMFALPCPFFYLSRNRIHLLSIITIFSAILLTGARSGLLMGTIELFCCLFISAIWNKKNRFLYVCLGIGLMGLIYLFGSSIMEFTTKVDLSDFMNEDEARWQLLLRGKDLFLDYPIFGHGLGYQGNLDLYSPVEGAMTWYHMMIPQVVASMGILGILAYVFQFFLQTRCVCLPLKATKDTQQRGIVLTLASSYIGVLLMSQVNPGLFCPLPYTLLGVLIFALIDGNDGPWPFVKKKKKIEVANSTESDNDLEEDASSEA